MLRLFKFYNFGEKSISFSGYFGVVYSVDDYYVDHTNKLLIIETTNHVFKDSLLDLITSESLLTWQRAIVSTLMASNGRQWTEIFAQFNSGTYNNQYMIVDTKRFADGNPQPDFLWIIEQMPKLTMSKDATPEFISNGHQWTSYNIPFFEEIWKYSGYDA